MAGGACAFLILLRGRGGEIEAWHRAFAGDCGRTLRRQLWTGGAALPDHVAPPDQAGVIDYRSLSGFTQRLVGANQLALASGLVTWTVDPALISTSRRDSSGSIQCGSVWLGRGQKIHWLAELVAAAGTGITHGAYGIYNAHLHLVADTADSPKAFATAPPDTWVRLPLIKAYKVPASGRYYLVDLLAGSIPPTVAVVTYTSGLIGRNLLLPSGVPRGIREGSGLSGLPSTLRNTGTDETRCIVAG